MSKPAEQWVRDWLPRGIDEDEVNHVIEVLREADKSMLSLQHHRGPVRLARVAAMLQRLLDAWVDDGYDESEDG